MSKKYSDVIVEMIGDGPVVDFANRVGVTFKTVYLWIQDQKSPMRSLDKLAKVATLGQMLRLLVALEILPDIPIEDNGSE